MQKSPVYEKNERIFTFSDIKYLFFRKKKILFLCSLGGALLLFSFSIIKPPQYQAEATFREVSERKLQATSLGDILGGSIGTNSQPQALVPMRSYQVMRPLVERVGLQVRISQKGLLEKIYRRFSENILMACGVQLKDLDPFICRDVLFEGEKQVVYGLIFEDEHNFTVLNEQGLPIVSGKVGETTRVEEVVFTCERTPNNLHLHQLYRMTVDPWIPTVKNARKNLVITNDKVDKFIYNLSFFDRDRHRAAFVLNQFMQEYQNYLKTNHDRLAIDQLGYLEAKQGQIFQKLSNLFDEHTQYLKSSLEEADFIELGSSEETALSPYRDMVQKVMRIDLELSQLRQLSEAELFAVLGEDGPLSKRLSEISHDIWGLKVQRDLLKSSLKENPSALRKTAFFDGIDLSTSLAFFMSYNEKFDASEARVRQLQQLREKVEGKEFEISSLGSFLEDPFSQNLIAEAGQIGLKLKDEKHHSAKEGQRWEEELVLQKRMLKEHLAQLINIEEVSLSLIRSKMVDLQHVSFDCIERQMAVLAEQAKEGIRERIEALEQEKIILADKMEGLRKKMSQGLPDKWRHEKWLEFRTEMETKMIQTLTEIVESKTIGHHLHHVESKPLDLAMIPVLPRETGLLDQSIFGFFVFGLVSFLFFFLQAIGRGFPSSFEKLQAMSYPLCGKILKEQNLDLFRSLSLFLYDETPGVKVISILMGRGVDYSCAFAEHLVHRGIRSVLVRCDFDRENEPEGIIQLVERAEISSWRDFICEEKGYHVLYSGGKTPYGLELIQSKAFRNVFDALKEEYDQVFLVFHCPLDSVESRAALQFCEKAVVTVCSEPTELLTPFINWAYHEKKGYVTFVTSNSMA